MLLDDYVVVPEDYEPSRSVGKRISRRIVRYQARRMVPIRLERPIVSFTFDDCPKSAVDNGVKKLEMMGWKSTIYIASGLFATPEHHRMNMTKADVLEAHEAGHEIGGHTFSHCDLAEVNFEAAIADIDKHEQIFSGLGLGPTTFAYPYGQTSVAVKKYLSRKYQGLRGVTSGVMHNRVDLNNIKSTPLFSGEPFEALLKQIQTLGPNSWLTIYTHGVHDDSNEFGCTPAEMEAVIEAVKNSGAEVRTVADAIETIKANRA